MKHRRPVLMEEDLFAMFDEDAPQSPDELPGRERQPGEDGRTDEKT